MPRKSERRLFHIPEESTGIVPTFANGLCWWAILMTRKPSMLFLLCGARIASTLKSTRLTMADLYAVQQQIRIGYALNISAPTENERTVAKMAELRTDCPMRHENGNCLPAGGFCTAVNDCICVALHNAYECGRADVLAVISRALKKED